MPDSSVELGHYWYKTEVDFTPEEAVGELHLMLSGFLNEGWIYVNRTLVAHREGYGEPWWRNDYRFEWEIDVSDHVKPGMNTVSLQGFNPHHWGGMFRRPFLYRVRH